MKKIIVFTLITLAFAGNALALRSTSGYFKKDGTYVNSYYSTSPNRTKTDNWSTSGNYNPYTGKKGTKKSY